MALAADTIHHIRNPLAECPHALHVYGGNLVNPARSLWNPSTLDEERFELSALARYERERTRNAGSGGNS
jgi:predicted metal-dependent enzyme (double-stranded beta helix superfamily)